MPLVGELPVESAAINIYGSTCGRVIQSSAPIRLGIVEGLDVRAGRFHNYPPRHAMGPQSAHPHIQLLRFFALRCFAVSFRCFASNRVRMCGSAGRNRVKTSTNCDAL